MKPGEVDSAVWAHAFEEVAALLSFIPKPGLRLAYANKGASNLGIPLGVLVDRIKDYRAGNVSSEAAQVDGHATLGSPFCPECRERTLTISGYPEGSALFGAVDYWCTNADCRWEVSLDPEGRPFDEESQILRTNLELLRAGIEP